jgi:Na+/alanine symporter
MNTFNSDAFIMEIIFCEGLKKIFKIIKKYMKVLCIRYFGVELGLKTLNYQKFPFKLIYRNIYPKRDIALTYRT